MKKLKLLVLVLALAVASCSEGDGQLQINHGVLIRSEKAASFLPVIILPKMEVNEGSMEELASFLEGKIFGSQQWVEPGRRIEVKCISANETIVVRLKIEQGTTALEMLSMIAAEYKLLFEVDDWTIKIKRLAAK